MLNPTARIASHSVGHGGEPVLVIDDALADLHWWQSDAVAGCFQPVGPYYPGTRAPMPTTATEALVSALAPHIAALFGVMPPIFENYYSLVTTKPGALLPIQRLPHFDGVERDRLAILLYMSGCGAGGTAFYRQRSTGFETIDAGRYAQYEAALSRDVALHGLPGAAYIAGDSSMFECIGTCQARPNRIVVYRGHLLHCAAITRPDLLTDDPSTGRLTANIFLYHAEDSAHD